MRKAAIILPTYNEVATIVPLIHKIQEVASRLKTWEIHVMVVDSASPDGTAQTVEEQFRKNPLVHLLKTKREGLGKAYLEGFAAAISDIKPYVLFEMDADFSHDPEKIPDFLHEIEQGADFVIGSRYMKGGSIPSDWAFHRKLFSVVGNWIIRLGFMKLKITEWTNGYRAIKTWVIQSSLEDIRSYTGYVFQIAILDNALKRNARVSLIPIHFADRKEGYSKINSKQYIAHILLYVFKNSSFIKFCIVGAIGFVVDFGISYLLIEVVHARVWLSTLVSAEIAIVSNFVLNNIWSFAENKIASPLHLALNFVKFNAIAVGSILIQAGGLELMVWMLGKSYWPLYKAGIILLVIIPYSYVLYTKFIWKK